MLDKKMATSGAGSTSNAAELVIICNSLLRNHPERVLLRGHFSRPQSVHKMSSRCVRKPRPTRDTEHCMQVKHSLCHWRSSKEMYLAPARPGEDVAVFSVRRIDRVRSPHLSEAAGVIPSPDQPLTHW